MAEAHRSSSRLDALLCRQLAELAANGAVATSRWRYISMADGGVHWVSDEIDSTGNGDATLSDPSVWTCWFHPATARRPRPTCFDRINGRTETTRLTNDLQHKLAFRAGGLIAAFTLALVLSVGCSGSSDPYSYVKVSGKVTYDDGSKVPGAWLQLRFGPKPPPSAISIRTPDG